MVVEQVSEVWGCLVVEGFVGEEKNLEVNPLGDREPVEVLEDRGDVIMSAGVGEEASSRVLDVLKFIEDFGW